MAANTLYGSCLESLQQQIDFVQFFLCYPCLTTDYMVFRITRSSPALTASLCETKLWGSECRRSILCSLARSRTGSVQLSYIVNRTPGHESRATFYPFFALRELSFLASRDFFRAAVFLCIVLVDAVLSNLRATSLYCSPAASASPLLTAVSKCLICVFIWLLRARLLVLLLVFCLALFFACNECATSIS